MFSCYGRLCMVKPKAEQCSSVSQSYFALSFVTANFLMVGTFRG